MRICIRLPGFFKFFRLFSSSVAQCASRGEALHPSRGTAAWALGVGLVLPRSRLENALGVVLLLESPQTLHGFFRKDAPHFVFVLGHGVVEVRRHVKRFQRFDEAVAPLLAGGAFVVVVVGPAGESRAPQASAASTKYGNIALSSLCGYNKNYSIAFITASRRF
jgi:hypothetical protein